LFPAKRRILEKREREQGLKSKRGETSYKEAPCLKKGEDEIYKMLGEILSKERKEITFSYSAKSDMWPHPTHHLYLHYLLFLDFSLSYPLSLHHSPSTMIICHTNSLEFSFAFTIYKV
jgi:hypothetical protein